MSKETIVTPGDKPEVVHASDCAINNAPALPAGECDCGAEATGATT